MGADWVSQNWAGNYSTLRVSLTCANGPSGSTGSFTNSSGTQYTWWGGGELLRHNFANLPSGYAQNQIRWDDTADRTFGHDGNGYLSDIAFGMHVQYGTTNGDWYGSIPAPARIPKRPSPPGTPSVVSSTPTSVLLTWSGSGDNGGAGIDGYLLRRWPGTPSNPASTGGYTNVSQENNTTRTDPGITPGETYTYGVYAHNGSADNGGYSNLGGTFVFTAPSGAYVSDGTSWRAAEVLESNGTSWLSRRIQVSNGSVWQDAI
jgi:hypothetical protein